MPKPSALRSVLFFADLSDQELRVLADSLEKRTFSKGMVIFHKHSPGDTMYIIESGKVRIFILSEFGQEISFNVYGPGDVFGELAILDGLPRSAGAVALERTETLTLHRDDFLRHLGVHPEMAQSIIKVLSARLRYTTAYVEGLAFLGVQDRVAAKILELDERYGTEEGIDIGVQLTQAELAGLVGATRESVNKALGDLRDQGLIRLEGQRITILDRLGLENRTGY
ncbi:MAG: Crp/Fnr family transcriptional regulator [Chloroflexi bacterium]|nr:Crp/Fnr family transcriptional regulator [Chloroflexota bacterium]MBU1751559.1 Crp/Fnr family transcriptional regulator [Chloroflexota bacterium]